MSEVDKNTKWDVPALCAIAAMLVGVGIWVGTIEFRIGVPKKLKPVPIGTILAWDQVIRDSDGTPTGETRPIPTGWAICDGNNCTPDLVHRFLRGSKTSGNNGEADMSTGNRDGGTDLDKHKHETPFNNFSDIGWAAVGAPWGTGSETGVTNVAPYMDSGRKANDKWKLTGDAYKAKLNEHTHGVNIVPKHYTVIFIMRIE